jgi:hypothetical protein
MSRVTVIVSLWFVLAGGIAERIHLGSPELAPPLLALGIGVTLAAWAALWIQFSRDEPSGKVTGGPRHEPWPWD